MLALGNVLFWRKQPVAERAARNCGAEGIVWHRERGVYNHLGLVVLQLQTARFGHGMCMHREMQTAAWQGQGWSDGMSLTWAFNDGADLGARQ